MLGLKYDLGSGRENFEVRGDAWVRFGDWTVTKERPQGPGMLRLECWF
jgi:hypothetical protein